MAKSFIDMPTLEFVVTYNADKSVIVEMDGELVATFNSKFDTQSYIMSQVAQRAKLMRRQEGEYTVEVVAPGGVPKARNVPAGPAVAKEHPEDGVVGTVTEVTPKQRAARKPKA